MTNDILSQVRKLKESGKLAEMKSSVLARFALMVLERKPSYYVVRRVFNDKFGPAVELDAYDTELDASKSRDDHGGIIQPVYLAPPVPAPDDVEARAERSADKIYYGSDDGHLAIDYDAVVEIITAAIKGEM